MNQQGVHNQNIQPFPFYSINECDHQQLLCHSKFPVYVYQHIASKMVFVVKEIPFKPKYIWIYRILHKLNQDNHIHLNVVPIFSVTLMSIKNINYKQKDKNYKTNPRIQSFLQNKSGLLQQNIQIKQKTDKKQKTHFIINNLHEDQLKQSNNCSWLLIWMEKCEMNLVEYVTLRRKQRHNFSSQQTFQFFFQLLTTFQKLQKQGLCHRDVKPQNILYQKGKYLLCDFDECIITKNKTFDSIKSQLQFTTILFSSCEFLKALRMPKNKYFDPYKLDVYSFGLTLLYFCSMGKFNVDDRHPFLYGQSGSHHDFISQQRRIFIKRNNELKIFNCILKLMLEEDEYKRDDFVTLNIKVGLLMSIQDHNQSDSVSDYSRRDRSLSTNVSNFSSLRLNNKHLNEGQGRSSSILNNRQKQIKNTNQKHRIKKGFAATKKQQKTLIIIIIGIFMIYTILLIV